MTEKYLKDQKLYYKTFPKRKNVLFDADKVAIKRYFLWVVSSY